MKGKIVHINELTDICGFFNSTTQVNNGYGCDHPNQIETDIDQNTHKEQGKCYSFSCPLANEADLSDLKEYDIYAYEEWKDEVGEPADNGAELLVIYDELVERFDKE